MDAGLIKAALRSAQNLRDFVLILAAGVTGLDVKVLTKMTVGDLRDALIEAGGPYHQAALKALAKWADKKDWTVLNKAFPSRKGGGRRCIGRQQVWRILSDAVKSISRNTRGAIQGAIRGIRALFEVKRRPYQKPAEPRTEVQPWIVHTRLFGRPLIRGSG